MAKKIIILKAARHKKCITYGIVPIRLPGDFSSGENGKYLKYKRKKSPTKEFYSAKLSFRNEGELMFFF